MPINRTLELRVAQLHDAACTLGRFADRQGHPDISHTLFGMAGELEGWERYLRCLGNMTPDDYSAEVIRLHDDGGDRRGDLPF